MDAIARLQAALKGQYAVDREIGRGGMAHVYLARDMKHNRDVAVKVLRPEVAETVGTDRFIREIETAAKLQHPHIVPIYDSGGKPPLLYYVMPFIDGESLRQRLEREGGLPIDDALRFGLEVAEALSFAHSLNVVHRDIKPENILLFRGHALVADFGVAKVLAAAGAAPGDAYVTEVGLAVGTPMYMSPEQAAGDSNVDGRCDLYSLACVMYEMLSGKPPFDGHNALAILARKHRERPAQLGDTLADVPMQINDAIDRALEIDPDLRYASVGEFADAMTSVRARSPEAVPSRTKPPKSIAVLPFTDHGAPGEDDHLCDGLAEDLIHSIASIDGLRVIARTSSFAFKGKEQDARVIGRELGVSVVLEGTLRRAQDRIRLNTQLVDVANGAVIWSERFDRRMTDLFAVQDEITRSIVDALKIKLLDQPARIVPTLTRMPDAYEAYLRGRFQWNLRTEVGLRRSLEELRFAIHADPNFALAHSAIAETYITMAIYGASAPAEVMPLARDAARAALALAPRAVEALTALGSVHALFEHDWGAAESSFMAAIDSGSQYPTTYQWFAMHCLAPQRRFSEARVRLARARELDPFSAAIECSAAILRFYERDFDQAIADFSALLQRKPEFALALYFKGQALSAIGRHEEAIDALSRAARIADSTEHVAALGAAYATAGNGAGAREAIAQLDARATTRYVSPVLEAQVYAALGDAGRATALLERALESKATELPLIGLRPAFDRVREDPRVGAVERRVLGK